MWSKLTLLLAAVANLVYPQQPRNLTHEGDSATGASIPRSYALVVGISEYQNLPDRSLQFAVRDAESIYAILISPDGGSFRAQNVHKLIGPPPS